MKAHSLSRTPRTAGFTLVELMVVVVIATILLSIAVPSYMAQVRESRRTDARTALLDLAGREESYNSTMNSYTVNPVNLGYPAFNAPFGNGYYIINTASTCVAAAGAVPACDPNVNAPTGPSYYLTATPVPGSSQAADAQCTSFSVDSLGNRFATPAANSALCWASK